jgi:hypothetical protein
VVVPSHHSNNLDWEVIDMASDNRSFLGIVLGAIMAALVLAAYFLYGQRGESTVKIDHPAIQVPEKPMVAVPPPMAPAAPAPAVPAAPPTNP